MQSRKGERHSQRSLPERRWAAHRLIYRSFVFSPHSERLWCPFDFSTGDFLHTYNKCISSRTKSVRLNWRLPTYRIVHRTIAFREYWTTPTRERTDRHTDRQSQRTSSDRGSLFLFVGHLLERQLEWPRAKNRSSSVNIRIPAVLLCLTSIYLQNLHPKRFMPKILEEKRSIEISDERREREREELLGSGRKGEDLTWRWRWTRVKERKRSPHCPSFEASPPKKTQTVSSRIRLELCVIISRISERTQRSTSHGSRYTADGIFQTEILLPIAFVMWAWIWPISRRVTTERYAEPTSHCSCFLAVRWCSSPQCLRRRDCRRSWCSPWNPRRSISEPFPWRTERWRRDCCTREHWSTTEVVRDIRCPSIECWSRWPRGQCDGNDLLATKFEICLWTKVKCDQR